MDSDILETIPATYPLELKEKILLEYSQNVQRYVQKKFNINKAIVASRIIFNVSLINKNLYKTLEQTRNNPIIARTIINNLAYSKDHSLDAHLADHFTFPGAQKCLSLSKTLYDNGLTKDLVEYLHQQGATLDYWDSKLNTCPVKYWNSYVKRNNPKSSKIVKKMLKLGTNVDQCNLLSQAIHDKNIELIQNIFHYSPAKNKCWSLALLYFPECIDILIPYSSPDELNSALGCCLDTNKDESGIMQKLIDNGADPNQALDGFLTPNLHLSVFDPMWMHNFLFLCKQKAFNKPLLSKLQHMQKILNSLVNNLESNKPVNNNTEQDFL